MNLVDISRGEAPHLLGNSVYSPVSNLPCEVFSVTLLMTVNPTFLESDRAKERLDLLGVENLYQRELT